MRVAIIDYGSGNLRSAAKALERAAAEAMPFVYLGFWVKESPKMEYKSRFRPIEGFGPAGWRPLEGFQRQTDEE